MTIKKVFFNSFISALFFVSSVANVHTANVQEALESASPEAKEAYETWYNCLSEYEQANVADSESSALYHIKKFNAIHTPEYKELVKLGQQISKVDQDKVVPHRLCGSKSDTILRFFNSNCKKANKMEKELRSMRDKQSELAKKAYATHEWLAWQSAIRDAQSSNDK